MTATLAHPDLRSSATPRVRLAAEQVRLAYGEHVVVDQRGRVEGAPAVHHPVPDGGDPGRGAGPLGEVEAAPRELVEHQAQRDLVVRDLGLTDPLDDATVHHLSRLRLQELVLQRRRARVEDQHGPRDDAHRALLSAANAWAWIAVMATVLTMSSTSAPRERSLIGALRPCRTGPIATAEALRRTAL